MPTYTAPPARTALNDTYPNPSNSVFRTGIGVFWDYLTNLLGTTGNPEDAQENLKLGDPSFYSNLEPSFAVGSNALTITVKGKGGVDLASTNPAYVMQRSSTASSAALNRRKITGNLSLVISAGSSLGLQASGTDWLNLYVLDNAGTQELAISRRWFGYSAIVSTSAEGGAGGADTFSTIYSTTARSSVPARFIGRFRAPQTVPGTWTALPTTVELMPIDDRSLGYRSISIPASANTPRLSNGCAALAYTAGAANQPDIPYLAFDGAAKEYAGFLMRMPEGWDRETIRARFSWRRASGTGAANVVFGIRAVAVKDDDTPAAAFGSDATVTTPASTTTANFMLSDWTSVCTVAGNPNTNSELVFFEIFRDGAAGGDTLNSVDAWLSEITISIGFDRDNDG